MWSSSESTRGQSDYFGSNVIGLGRAQPGAEIKAGPSWQDERFDMHVVMQPAHSTVNDLEFLAKKNQESHDAYNIRTCSAGSST